MPSEKRENLNGTEITTPTPEKKGLTKIQKYIAIAAIGILIAGGIAGGVTTCAINQERAAATADAEATGPQSTNSELAVETTAETASPTELALKQKVEKYAGAMEKYKEMSVDEFEALPRDKRLQYGQYIIDDTVVNGGLFELYYSVDNKKEYTPVSVNNTGQQIEENSEYMYQIACSQSISSGDLGKMPKLDTANAIKCLSNNFYDVGENKPVTDYYLTFKKFFEERSEPNVFSRTNIATNTSDPMDGVDSSGNKIRYKDVTLLDDNGTTYYVRFNHVKFPDYDGMPRETWLIDAQSLTLEGLDR
jgi:hypothetical protein